MMRKNNENDLKISKQKGDHVDFLLNSNKKAQNFFNIKLSILQEKQLIRKKMNTQDTKIIQTIYLITRHKIHTKKRDINGLIWKLKQFKKIYITKQ